MRDKHSSTEKTTAELLQEANEAKSHAQWATIAEKLASYAAIITASLLIITNDLTPFFENRAVKYHAEHPDEFLTLDQAIEFHQMMGWMMSFVLLRLAFSGVLAIPRHIFFKTAFGHRARKLVNRSWETCALQLKRIKR